MAGLSSFGFDPYQSKYFYKQGNDIYWRAAKAIMDDWAERLRKRFDEAHGY